MFNSNVQRATIDDCFDYCSSKHTIAVDTETQGLDFTFHKMIMLQIGDQDQQFVIDTRDTDISKLKTIFESQAIVKVFHNAKFDYKFLKNHNISTNNIYDTYLVEKILYCGDALKGYSLKSLVNRYLNIDLSKDARSSFNSNTSSPYTEHQITYGAKDVEYLIQIKDLQQSQITEKQLEQVVDLENKVVKVFSEIEYQGLDIDKKEWEKLYLSNKELVQRLVLDLDDIVLNNPKLKKKYHIPVQQDLFKSSEEIRKTNINWDSPKQVLNVFQILFPKLEDVNGKKLYKFKYHELVKKYLSYKESSKLASTYGDKFYEHLKHNNRVHTDFNQILNTGRVSSSSPNMQQIPSNNSYRNCFVAPKGYVFVSSDYSSQELNVLAYWSNDPVFLKALQNNEDLHSVCAELIFDDWDDKKESNCMYAVNKSKCDCKEHKIYRNKAKSINFGLAYGMGPHKLSDTLDIPMSEASELIEKFFNAFPNIKKFLDQRAKFGKLNGFITTLPPFKRRRYFPEWDPDYVPPKELGEIERASKNTSIQGTSADMLKLAMYYIYKHIDENNLHNDIKIVMTVHDQIDTICKEELSEKWVKTLTSLMQRAADTIIKNKLLKAESFISERWSK